MQNKYQISFYANSNDVTVGALKSGDKMLLATTHPATIAYALQALGADSVEFVHQSMRFEISLPGMLATTSSLAALEEHAQWVVHFMMFSQIDSFSPPAQDEEADIHLRTALHFLPKKLAVRKPTSAKPQNWRTALKFRKDFIYYPFC